jgi:hypothetical protein
MPAVPLTSTGVSEPAACENSNAPSSYCGCAAQRRPDIGAQLDVGIEHR